MSYDEIAELDNKCIVSISVNHYTFAENSLLVLEYDEPNILDVSTGFLIFTWRKGDHRPISTSPKEFSCNPWRDDELYTSENFLILTRPSSRVVFFY